MHLTINQITTGGDVETRNEDTDFVLVYVFAMIFIVTVFTVSRYLMQSVVEERETSMVEIIISSIRPAPLLIGKILAMGLLGLIQMGMLLGVGAFILVQLSASEDALTTIDIQPQALVLMLIYFIGGYLFLGSLFAGVGAISTSMREGPQIAAVFSLPAVAPLWVTFIFATDPHGTLPVALSLFPLTAPLAMIMRIAIADVPLWQIVLSIGLLGLAIGGAMWFAGRLFRVRTLLSGTRPRIRDVPRLLFAD
jgi:ABC-2 type transport system permease protein